MLSLIFGVLLLALAAFLGCMGHKLFLYDGDGGRDNQGKLILIRLRKTQIIVVSFISFFGLFLLILSTIAVVGDDQGGLVRVNFGKNLPASGAGSIVATKGEKGPQAKVLPQGVHFWYWPFLYSVSSVDIIDIPEGKIGIVTAKDGLPLPKDTVFADTWKDPAKLLDGQFFLTEGKGYKGPQLTVLPPAKYRYNPRLFKIEFADALDVKVGTVAVIKANAGEVYKPKEGEKVEVVNGVPIVPNGYRGIWKDALTPNMYYMHPNAYDVKLVQTVKRVYSYTSAKGISSKSDRPGQDFSMGVRTKDAFEFPVDVRVSVKVLAENASYVVALLQDPDADLNEDGFDILEEKAVLPSLRSIFRNTGEDKGAIAYVQSRSEIETAATLQFTNDMKAYRIEVDKVYIAKIGLSDTEEGKKLLQTQTNKEIALREQEMYKEQVLAENERAKEVKAKTEAEKQKDIVESEVKIEIAKNEADARIKKAEGDATYNAKVIESLGGVESYVMLELARDAITQWKGSVPSILSIGNTGSGGGLMNSLVATMLKNSNKPMPDSIKAILKNLDKPKPIANK